MEDIEIIRNQRDILFNACKSVVKDKKCPDWIAKVLTTAALNAKQLQKDVVVKTEMLLFTVFRLLEKSVSLYFKFLIVLKF